MSFERYYKPMRSIPVEGITWQTVNGDPLPQIGIPLKEEHLPSLCRFTVKNRGDNISSPQLIQISPAEERTFEVRFGNTRRILFEDEYKNLYSCLDLKGNRSTVVNIRKMSHSPSGFAFWGIQESDSLLRALKASNFIRSLRVDTEIILKVMEPTQIPINGQFYTPEELKTKLLLGALERVSTPKKKKYKLESKDIPDLATALEGMSFVHTLRGKQVNERVFDLNKATPQAVKQMIENTFWFYNYQGSRKATEKEPFTPLDPDNPQDVTKYFLYLLPFSIGRNYGIIHEAGVVHLHPHLQNISLLGGIYDTDSCKGEPLKMGDDPITEEEQIQDLSRLLYGYWNDQVGRGMVPFIKQLLDEETLPLEQVPLAVQIFEANLISEYILNRSWSDDLILHLNKILKILDHPKSPSMNLTPGIILTILSKLKQWNYDFEIDDNETIAAEMIRVNANFWRDHIDSMDETDVVEHVFKQSDEEGAELIRRLLYKKAPEAFDEVKRTKGEKSSEALLEIITRKLTLFYSLGLLDEMFGRDADNPKNCDLGRAKKYIKDRI